MSINKSEKVTVEGVADEEARARVAEAISIRSRVFLLWQQLGMALVLIALFVVLSIIAPNFLTVRNLVNVTRQVSVNAILAAGATFVILTGGIDLSVGAVLALSGIISVMLAVHGVNSALAVLAGLLGGAVCGLLNGLLVSRFKLQPFIVTLGAMTYVRGVAYLTTGEHSITTPDLGFSFLGQGYLGPVPWPVVIALLTYIAGYLLLRYTTFGRHVYAVGGNEQAARLSGINVDFNLLWVYIIGGLCAGLGGIILSARLMSGDPNVGTGYELDAISAVVLGGTSLIGGKGSIVGTLIGALIIGILSNGLVLMNVDFYVQLVIKGVVIILAILLDRLRTRAAAA